MCDVLIRRMAVAYSYTYAPFVPFLLVRAGVDSMSGSFSFFRVRGIHRDDSRGSARARNVRSDMDGALYVWNFDFFNQSSKIGAESSCQSMRDF